MGFPLLATALFAVLGSTASIERRATTLIPRTVFDSTANLEQYFTYNYPWGGNTHNGGARMDKDHVKINTPGTLTITAQKVSGQPPATHGGQQIAINYLSGAIGAKQKFRVDTGQTLVFSGSFQAPVAKGTWPAFWLSGASSWPPEVDMAEWKGSGKISFNTFNTSSSVSAKDMPYPNPSAWHDIKCQLRDHGNGRVQVKYFLDGVEQTTHYGKDYVGKDLWLIINLQMEGSSGSPGPGGNTLYQVRNLLVERL